MQVLSVASEVFPLVKTGGLADVVGALPAALARQGVEVVTLVPGYPAVLDSIESGIELMPVRDLFGGPASVIRGRAAGLDIVTIKAPHLFDRPGNPYLGPDGRDWPDNPRRFASLARVAASLGQDSAPGLAPEIIHAHDWQAGLIPAYLQYSQRERPGTVLTVHNLAFQGNFAPYLLGSLGLPPESYTYDGVEFAGSVSYLKAGLQFADRITTVSPTYAAEIATAENGMGLDTLLRWRGKDLLGILNGIDETVWNPATDPHLAARFSRTNIVARETNKTALRARLGLAQRPGSMLIGVVSRLSWQKGLDLLLAALPALRALEVQLAILGSGDAALESGFRDAARADPENIGFTEGYDEPLAHLIQGGSDALMVPSRFEPCGLTQLCAMRYGAIPIVARVGGLNDTVVDANEMALAACVATGFQFFPVDRPPLERAVGAAVSAWRRPEIWRKLQANAMRAEVGWRRPAERYAALYREIASRPT